MAAGKKNVKEEARWEAKAPVKNCTSCKHVQRFGKDSVIFYCVRIGQNTKGMAICRYWERSVA